MAELEVVKHTKKIYRIFHSENPIVEKLIEFVGEIFIIVFAVSITIWFHDMAEHRHQQKEVKEFLLGLKTDLQADLAEMQADKEGYKHQQAAFTFFRSMDVNDQATPDSLKKYSDALFSSVALVENNGRFEGFKSSGKIGNIENVQLQNDILDFYQELIPSLLVTTQIYNAQKDRLTILIEQHGRIDPEKNGLVITDVMKMDQAKIISTVLMSFPAEVMHRYDLCIERIEKIVKAIDEEYKQ